MIATAEFHRGISFILVPRIFLFFLLFFLSFFGKHIIVEDVPLNSYSAPDTKLIVIATDEFHIREFVETVPRSLHSTIQAQLQNVT